VGNKRRYIRYTLISLLWLACLAAYCLGLNPTSAQEPVVTLDQRPRPGSGSVGGEDRLAANIRINADLVLIPVLVTDPNDHLITGLEKEHFRLFDDKVEQAITQFAMEDAPASIGLVFDSSGSMGSKLQKSRAAVSAFLRTSNPEDEFSLVTFNDRAQLVTTFTDRIEDIQNRLMLLQPWGRTALLDAVYMALDEMKRARHSRKAILIISDGGDNSSRYSYREVKNYVREGDVQIYSIGILEPVMMRSRTPEEAAGPMLLKEIAQLTGGRLYEVDDISELSDIASKIGAALRNQYVLGYMPAEAKHDGKYHRIEVKIEQPKGLPPLRATFRSGYYAR
jgi:Ca-activated chloride channel homolog